MEDMFAWSGSEMVWGPGERYLSGLASLLLRGASDEEGATPQRLGRRSIAWSWPGSPWARHFSELLRNPPNPSTGATPQSIRKKGQGEVVVSAYYGTEDTWPRRCTFYLNVVDVGVSVHCVVLFTS